MYYILALVGAVMTAISFLKLGGAAFFGALKLPQGVRQVKEGSLGMTVPALALAALCLFFGIGSGVVHTLLLQPALGQTESFAGWPQNGLLVALSCGALLLALFDHLYGRKKTGGALGSADHIHYAPVLKQCYSLAEAGKLDPYNWLTAAVNGFSRACRWVESGVSWVYDKGVPNLIGGFSKLLHREVNGSLTRYLVLSIAGLACVVVIFLIVLL